MVDELFYDGTEVKVSYDRCGKLVPVKAHYTVTVHGEYPTFRGPAVPCAMEAGHPDPCQPYPFGDRFGYREPTLHPRDKDSDDYFADVINFPMRPEQELRRQLQIAESMRHPAKANIFMMEEIWRYVSLPGETIVDFFGGTGTTGIAAREGRSVILLDVEEFFIRIQRENAERLSSLYGTPFFSILGDNRKTLPTLGTVDHIMGSPPYAGALTRGEAKSESDKQLTGNMFVQEYTASQGNLGIANKFQYNMQMTKVYQESYKALRPGGTLTTIMGDITSGGKRQTLSSWVYKTCGRIGFQLIGHYRRYMPGTSYKAVHKARGAYVVEDEDIIIFRKPD